MGGFIYNWVLYLSFILALWLPLRSLQPRVNYEVEKASGGYISQQVMLTRCPLSCSLWHWPCGEFIAGFSLWYLIIQAI